MSLSARLARLEQRSAKDRPTGAQTEKLRGLLARLEEVSEEPWVVALHRMACSRGTLGKDPLRDPDTVPEIDVLTWSVTAIGNRRQLSSPLCPLCSTASAG